MEPLYCGRQHLLSACAHQESETTNFGTVAPHILYIFAMHGAEAKNVKEWDPQRGIESAFSLEAALS